MSWRIVRFSPSTLGIRAFGKTSRKLTACYRRFWSEARKLIQQPDDQLLRLAYSTLACFRMGMSGSAYFPIARKAQIGDSSFATVAARLSAPIGKPWVGTQGSSEKLVFKPLDLVSRS